MQHRGPDDSGSWWSANGTVGLAMRRLAIIDLSPGGHQPMLDEARSLTIVFNGEIYNYLELRGLLMSKGHTFRTQSDTEVILAAYREWGTDCLAHLNGMFASRSTMRDRTSCCWRAIAPARKPLFYSVTDGVLRFFLGIEGPVGGPEFRSTIDRPRSIAI